MRSQNAQFLESLLKSISEDEFYDIADKLGITFEDITDEELENLTNANYLYFLPQLEEYFKDKNLDENSFISFFKDTISEESLNKTLKTIHEVSQRDIKNSERETVQEESEKENVKHEHTENETVQREFEEQLQRFEENPFEGFINLENLTDAQTIKAGETLKRVYETQICSRTINEKILVCYKINGEENWRPIDNSDVRKTLERMIKGNYLFSVDNISSNLSDPEADVCLSFFDAIGFKIQEDNYKGKHSSHHNQAFYPYRLVEKAKVLKFFTKKFALGYYIWSKKHKCPKTWVKECCLIWAIKQFFYELNKSETLTHEQSTLLNNISHDIDMNKHISTSGLKTIGDTYNIKFIVHAFEDRDGKSRKQNQFRGGFYGSKNPIYTIELGYKNNHCFLYTDVPVSHYFIKNIDEIMTFGIAHKWTLEKCFSVVGKRKNGCWQIDSSRAHMNSLTLLKRLDENNLVIPLMRNDEDVDLACIQEWIPSKGTLFEDKDGKLLENPTIAQSNIKLIAPEISKEIYKEPSNKLYFYADFETCSKDVIIDGYKYKQETPFLVCVQSEDGTMKETFKGFDCAEKLMDYLPDGSIIYFHNLGFDGRLLMKHGVASNIMKGSKIISQKHLWKGKKIAFKDSYSLFPQALKTFPDSFKKEFKGLNIQKELFPYRYYTFERISSSNVGLISECGNDEQPPWNEAQRKQFKENINKIPGCLISENEFDLIKYCEFYCQEDVNVLRIGFNAFRQAALNKPIEMDIFNLTTAPSLANEYLNKNVFYPNGYLYKYSGILQNYIMGAIYGGRCMTKQNKRWLVEDKILDDFDACSLYPSAMARLFSVEGKPEIIPDDFITDEIFSENNQHYLLKHAFDENQLVPSEDKFISYFIADIEIINVGIERDFPLIVNRDSETNTNMNVNASKIETIKRDSEGNEYKETTYQTMRVDLIMLEDLVKFQKIQYKIKRGIYWTDKRDHTIRTTIRELFEQRAKYKREGNSIQQVMKLIMNSGYGKSIQKPIKTDTKYIKKEKLDHYIYDHYHNIEEVSFIQDSDTAIVKINKQLINQFNNCVFGVSVLSMSKRIMNEVMCLAEDLKISIYYQDTDSMHIEHDKLQLLSEEYKKLYGRELIGENIMGCFHNDFDELKNAYCTFHVSLGKKMYYDALENDKGEKAEHFRMKGIPSDTIKRYAEKNFNGSVKELYLFLYNGGSIDFDLADGKTMFQMEKTGEILHKNEFKRVVKATAPKA